MSGVDYCFKFLRGEREGNCPYAHIPQDVLDDMEAKAKAFAERIAAKGKGKNAGAASAGTDVATQGA